MARTPPPSASSHRGVVLLALAAALAAPGPAGAHSTTFAVYSKYEATTSGNAIAFVFALDRASVVQLIERDVTHGPVAPESLEQHRAWFSRYLFDRFSVSNAGQPCQHPAQLGRFFWDQPTGRVVAVTKFVCPNALSELHIRSLVTHDMPTAHEMVGDLRHGEALERSFFYNDTVEARVSLSAMGTGEVRRPGQRSKFSYVAVPDRVRRYERLAAEELGSDAAFGTGDGRLLRTLVHFIGQGVLHILTGYDHVLFILTLLFGVATWRRLAVIVTSFTAAHSVTLILSTLGLVTVPAQVIEPLIAASVLFVAVDAVLRPQASVRASVTFVFGLVHGFGLSNVLRAEGLSGSELLPALLGFNLGVEVGQLAIVAPLFPLVLWLRPRAVTYERTRNLLCGAVAVLAVFWIVVRVGEAFTG